MKLPHGENARVDQSKVVDYLLSFEHPEGAGKAEFFESFGFKAANWQVLADALVAHARAHPVSSVVQSRYGTTVVHIYPHHEAFEVEFVTLTGRTAKIVTVPAAQVRPVAHGEITHARTLAIGPTNRASE